MNAHLRAFHLTRVIVLALIGSAALSSRAAAQEFGQQLLVDQAAHFARSVYAADVDGDGDADVLSASSSDSKITWYENTDGVGGGMFKTVITAAAQGASEITAADVDGDGDIDVLSASQGDNTVEWFLNSDGGGGSWSEDVLSTNAMGAWSVCAADLDGDGDPDAMSASVSDNTVAWYRNDGVGAWLGTDISTSAKSAQSVFAGDVDGDGDLDVLFAAFAANTVAWCENTDGLGSFGILHNITTQPDGVEDVFAEDLDGDGWLDVLSASFNDSKIAWYRNTDGLGQFGPQKVISSGVSGARSVFAIDLDADGDADVLSASRDDDRIAWYENADGVGGFGPQKEITQFADGARAVFAADLDGDGGPDVLSASSFDDKIAWYRNLMGPFAPALLGLAPDSGPSAIGALADLTLKLVPDGPAELVLGSLALPIAIAGGTAQVLIPPLGYASSSDVVVDAYVRWDDGGAWIQTEPLVGAFTWDIPNLVAVTPPSAPFDVFTGVLIELSENVITSGIGLVRFGDEPASVGNWFELGGTTYVTTIAPPQPAPGDFPVELEITAGGLTEYTRAEDRALVYLGPGIGSMSATSGFQGGGEAVTFELVDFVPGIPVDVYFGAAWTSGTPSGFLSLSTLDVVTPLSPVAGVVDLTFEQDLGGGAVKTADSPGAWEYLPPTVGTLSASSGPQAGGEALYVPTEGFASGAIDVTLGGVVLPGVVSGVGPSQQVDFVTQAGEAGLSDLQLVQGVFDVTVKDAYEMLAPTVSTVTPSGAGWYEAAAVAISGANFAPAVPAEVQIGSDAPIPAAVQDGQTVTFDVQPDSLSGMGQQQLVLRQAGIEALGAWTVLPEFAVSVTGDAASGMMLDFDVASAALGGTATVFWSVLPLPMGIPLYDWHGALTLGPPGGLVGVGPLGASPTLTVPVAAGAVSAGVTVYFQVLAFELDGLGGQFFAFTNTQAVIVP